MRDGHALKAALALVLLGSCAPGTPQSKPVTVSTLAGSGVAGKGNGPVATATFNNPVNVVRDPAGNLYVADFNDSAAGSIRKITPQGMVSTLPTPDTFERPFGLAYHNGFLYITTDRTSTGVGDSSLWELRLSDNNLRLVVDNINQGRVRGIVVRADGKVVASDRRRHVLYLIDPAGGAPVRLAGKQDESGMANGDADQARFNGPYGMALLGQDVLVADTGNNCIRRVKLDGNTSTFAGVCGPGGYRDGASTEALFLGLQDLATDSQGNVYVSDNGNHRIRKVSTDGKVSTLAGNGIAGFKDGEGMQAQFYGQEGIEVDGNTLVVADGNNGEDLPYRRIRTVTLP